MSVGTATIQWRDADHSPTVLVAGSADLQHDLAAHLPNSSMTAQVNEPTTTIVAGRGAIQATGDDRLSNGRLVVLLDPTEDDRRRTLRALAGRADARLVSLPSLSTISAAEHALLLMLALSRNLFQVYASVVSGQRRAGLRAQLTSPEITPFNWTDTDSPLPLHRQTLGIVGLGRVGEALASRAIALGMTVIYHDQEAKPAAEIRHTLVRRRFDQVLREADVVSLHLPLTPDTVRIIDAPELALMKRSAFLINTAHGRLVDEGSLMKALHTGDIAGAGLDVLAYEPLPHDSPFLRLNNVILTPHIAGIPAEEERRDLARRAAQVLQDDAGK